MTGAALARRAFLNSEADRLGRFVDIDSPGELVGYGRSYRCECGFVTASAADIWDHAAEHANADLSGLPLFDEPTNNSGPTSASRRAVPSTATPGV